MASAEPITGVWGQSLQRGPGAEPLVRGSWGRNPQPPEADSILAFERQKKAANLPLCLYLAMSVHYTPRLFSWVILCFHHIILQLPCSGPYVSFKSLEVDSAENFLVINTFGKLHNDVFNFVFLDCTISHFGLHYLHLRLHKLVGLYSQNKPCA